MITEEDLAQQFTTILEHTHPSAWEVIRHCYVKVVNPQFTYLYPTQFHKRYVSIYCPDKLMAAVLIQKNLLREVAQYLGLIEVVCLNASNLVRDPMSKLKRTHPQLWLDLLWILSTKHDS
ncbi:hypothetical protein H6G76_15460 [Nostoc sp. FACHB-152]|uniref:hypothetical protein n=1 Tax=unclassified Nostoc TaxID=2593658 RepID=UPI001686E587|nr:MULTISPECIES: hypothetical protein [unclassified Nostoc]MBD2448529.1 hypothetical protein [Nostoc sp. FACHB-152]MBD2466266.1 hypothetical protein [Nostoc sp. FACHB-145]